MHEDFQSESACKCLLQIDRKLHNKSEIMTWKESNLWFKQIPLWNVKIPVDLGFNIIEHAFIDWKHTYSKWVMRLINSSKSQSNSIHATNWNTNENQEFK